MDEEIPRSLRKKIERHPLLKRYHDHLGGQSGYTKDGKLSIALRFILSCERDHVPLQRRSALYGHLTDFMNRLSKTNSPASLHLRATQLNDFMKYLQKVENLIDEPELGRIAEKLDKYGPVETPEGPDLSPEEEEAIKKITGWPARYIIDTARRLEGPRPVALGDMRTYDIDFERHRVGLREKEGKGEITHYKDLSEDNERYFKRLLQLRQIWQPDHPFVFFPKGAQGWDRASRLHRGHWVSACIVEAGRKVGIRLTLYKIRRSCGGDAATEALMAAAKTLGHKWAIKFGGSGSKGKPRFNRKLEMRYIAARLRRRGLMSEISH
jgi:hypothetical protein